jgi:glycosyltransferase involved in cell wall biosynthesis
MTPVRLAAIIEATVVTGPAKNLIQFAERTRGRVQLRVVTWSRPGQARIFADSARAAGIDVTEIPERGAFDSGVIPRLRDAVKEWDPHVVQTHAVKSHFLARLARVHRLAPWVAFHHGYTLTDLRTQFLNQLDRWSLRAARRVVTVSLPFRDQLCEIGVPQDKILVLHNAIEPNWGRRLSLDAEGLRASMKISPQAPVVLIVGRLSREKDHSSLLHAIARLRNAGVAAPHLVIVGDGPDRPMLDQKIAQLGLSQHVSFTGQVKTAEPYYGIASVAVLSSVTEGSPNALLEAMADGRRRHSRDC